ncbi:MAG: 3-oxoacyl-[acyl-carrier-protein] synthase-3 [Paracoccaceae bacterium]|jgi:3-oxoacyl-[acyl-carrier-protein] synthase-3
MANNKFSICGVAAYVPQGGIYNADRIGRFGYDPESLKSKIGVMRTTRKDADETTSDMCVRAFEALVAKLDGALDPDSLDLIVVVTQHPDGYGLPHTSAVVHGKLGLPKTCFAFDISLGCSGYVSALATVAGHLQMAGGTRAVLITADPYSVSVSEDDKNTAMIFGDAATATLIAPGPDWQIGAFDFGTNGSDAEALMRTADGVLKMDGRSVFNFCALNVPGSVTRTLERNGITKDDVDAWVMHPGSKYIVDTICKRLKIPPPATLPCINTGNTVSSSLPLILADLDPRETPTVLVSGFGVGLGWATCILTSQPE